MRWEVVWEGDDGLELDEGDGDGDGRMRLFGLEREDLRVVELAGREVEGSVGEGGSGWTWRWRWRGLWRRDGEEDRRERP